MQPQLPLVHQFLDKVSNEQHPGHHQHQWKDIRDGLQVPGGYRRSNCIVAKTHPITVNNGKGRGLSWSPLLGWEGGDNRVQILLMPINPSSFYFIFFLLICKVWWSRIFQLFFFLTNNNFSQQSHQALTFR